MNKLFFIIVIMIAGICFSCQEDPIGIEEPNSKIQLKAAGELDLNTIEVFNRLGISDSGIIRIQRYLLEIGIARENVNPVMRVIPAITREVLMEGKEFELSIRIENYLQNELGLTDDQIQVVISIATRIANIQSSER